MRQWTIRFSWSLIWRKARYHFSAVELFFGGRMAKVDEVGQDRVRVATVGASLSVPLRPSQSQNTKSPELRFRALLNEEGPEVELMLA